MKKAELLLSILLIFTCRIYANNNSYVEYLPENLFDAVALIETIEIETGSDGDSTTYRPVSSSLLIYSEERYFILTAGHVSKRHKNLVLRLNREDGAYKRFSLDSLARELGIKWQYNDKYDICALKFETSILKNVREKPINLDLLSDNPKEYMLGTGIFIVGYPASVSKIDYHVVRKGAISAFVDDNKFLIDCFVFPGNSGGPVFLSAVPDIVASTKYKGLDFEMTIPGRDSKFLGIITDYLPYSELAISEQTHKPRIRFEENSGLSVAISAPVILEFIRGLK